jgi:hypothetical protein
VGAARCVTEQSHIRHRESVRPPFPMSAGNCIWDGRLSMSWKKLAPEISVDRHEQIVGIVRVTDKASSSFNDVLTEGTHIGNDHGHAEASIFGAGRSGFGPRRTTQWRTRVTACAFASQVRHSRT